LYLFLRDYAFDIVRREYYQRIEPCGGDLIARYSQAALRKMELFERYPQLFEFLKGYVVEESAEVSEENKKKSEEMMAEGYSHLLEGIDQSLFRGDIPADKVKDIIIWAIEGYGNRAMAQARQTNLGKIDLKAATDDFDSYLDVLRRCFYNCGGAL